MIHRDDVVALLAVGARRGLLHVLNGTLRRNDVRDFEERRLQNRVDAPAKAQLLRDLRRVYYVKVNLVLGDVFFHSCGQLGTQFGQAPRAIQEKTAAFFEFLYHVVALEVGRVVAGDEVGRADVVRRLDGRLAEAQVRDRQAAGLLRVVGEIALHKEVGLVADDLDRIFVCADGAVRAKAPELARAGARLRGVRRVFCLKREVRNVVYDANGKALFRGARAHILEDRNDVGRRGVFRAKPVSAGVNRHVVKARIRERSQNVQVERLADGTGLLCAIENRNNLRRGGQFTQQELRNKRPVQAHFQEANFLARGIQKVNNFLNGFANRAHRHDDFFGVRRTVVVKRPVVGAGFFVDEAHIIRDDFGHPIVVAVAGLTSLEENVIVLCRAPQNRVFWA